MTGIPTSVRRVFWLGLWARILYLAAVLSLNPQAIFYNDSLGFLEPFISLLTDGVYGVGGAPDPFRTPGYPIFCAMVSLLGAAPVLIPVVQTLVVYPLTFLLIHRTVRGHPQTWLAMLVLALDVPHIVYGSTIMADSLFLLGLTYWLYAASQHGLGFGTGILTGVLYLIRPILWPFLLAIIIVQSTNVRKVALFLLGLSIVVVPWIARNRVTFDHYFVSIHTTESLFKTLVPPLLKPGDPEAQKAVKAQLLEQTDLDGTWPTHMARQEMLMRTVREHPTELLGLFLRSVPAFLLFPERSSWATALQLDPLPGRLGFRNESLLTRLSWLMESPIQFLGCLFQIAITLLTWVMVARARRFDLKLNWLIVLFVTLTFWVSTTSLTARKRIPLLAVLPALMLSRRTETGAEASDLT